MINNARFIALALVFSEVFSVIGGDSLDDNQYRRTEANRRTNRRFQTLIFQKKKKLMEDMVEPSFLYMLLSLNSMKI